MLWFGIRSLRGRSELAAPLRQGPDDESLLHRFRGDRKGNSELYRDRSLPMSEGESESSKVSPTSASMTLGRAQARSSRGNSSPTLLDEIEYRPGGGVRIFDRRWSTVRVAFNTIRAPHHHGGSGGEAAQDPPMRRATRKKGRSHGRHALQSAHRPQGSPAEKLEVERDKEPAVNRCPIMNFFSSMPLACISKSRPGPAPRRKGVSPFRQI